MNELNELVERIHRAREETEEIRATLRSSIELIRRTIDYFKPSRDGFSLDPV